MDWWKRGLQMSVRIQPAGLVLAAVYALSCWAARQVSMDQFYLPAGVRVAALLVLPPRCWPYLVLGEYAYFAHTRLPMIERYGMTWVVLGSVLLLPFVAAVVQLHAKRMRLQGPAWLLSIALSAAVGTTLINLGLAHLLWPTPPANAFLMDAFRSMVGQFVGVLALAPLALLWLGRGGWRFNEVSNKAAMLALALMTGLALMTAAPAADDPSVKAALHHLMVLPAIALTCLTGWRGAAISCSMLHLTIGLTTASPLPWSFDPTSFGAQQGLAVSGTALLVLGGMLSHHRGRARRAEEDESKARMAVKASQIASERNLRDCVHGIRAVGEGIDRSMSELCKWVGERGHSHFADALLRVSVQNSTALRSKASLVYPVSLDHVGLYLALQVSGIAETWQDTGRVKPPGFSGDPCQLSLGLQLAAYRVLQESVSTLLENEAGHVRIRARAWKSRGKQGMLMVANVIDSAALSRQTGRLVMTRLPGHVVAYQGVVECRGGRVRMALYEECAAAKICGEMRA